MNSKVVVLSDELGREHYFGYGHPENYLVGCINFIEYNRIVIKDNGIICGFATVDEIFAKANIDVDPDMAPHVDFEIHENNDETVVDFKLCKNSSESVSILKWIITDNADDIFTSNTIDLKYPEAAVYISGVVVDGHYEYDDAGNIKSKKTTYYQ